MFAIASVNLSRTALDILQNTKRLDAVRADVALLEGKKATLSADIDHKKSDDFIEERARNALNMIKPNEKVFVVDKSVLAVSDTREAIIPQSQQEKTASQMWLDLFL